MKKTLEENKKEWKKKWKQIEAQTIKQIQSEGEIDVNALDISMSKIHEQQVDDFEDRQVEGLKKLVELKRKNELHKDKEDK